MTGDWHKSQDRRIPNQNRNRHNGLRFWLCVQVNQRGPKVAKCLTLEDTKETQVTPWLKLGEAINEEAKERQPSKAGDDLADQRCF